MPLQAPHQEEQSLNAWLEQTTQELNDSQDDIEALRALIVALTARVTALEP